MSTIIDTLITDRTAADVACVNELAAKGYAGMTAAELAEWLAGMKGAYNGETKVWMGEAGATAKWTDAAFVPI